MQILRDGHDRRPGDRAIRDESDLVALGAVYGLGRVNDRRPSWLSPSCCARRDALEHQAGAGKGRGANNVTDDVGSGGSPGGISHAYGSKTC